MSVDEWPTLWNKIFWAQFWKSGLNFAHLKDKALLLLSKISIKSILYSKGRLPIQKQLFFYTLWTGGWVKLEWNGFFLRHYYHQWFLRGYCNLQSHDHHWMFFVTLIIDINGFSIVLGSFDHWLPWFSMVRDRWLNNGKFQWIAQVYWSPLTSQPWRDKDRTGQDRWRTDLGLMNCFTWGHPYPASLSYGGELQAGGRSQPTWGLIS